MICFCHFFCPYLFVICQFFVCTQWLNTTLVLSIDVLCLYVRNHTK